MWAEDPVRVERGNRVEQLALADVDRLGVVGVVGALAALAAEHPAPAGVEHHAAQHVRVVSGWLFNSLPSREPRLICLRALNSSNIHFGINGSCAGAVDHTHFTGR